MPKNPEKNKKTGLIVAIILALILLVAGFVFYKVLSDGKAVTPPPVAEKIKLDDEYKNTDGKMIEIAKETDDAEGYLKKLTDAKKNFVMYVSLPICNGDAAMFKEFVKDFQKNNKLSFYYLTSDYVKDTSIYDTVKYYPSVILYKDGKLTNYLHYDLDQDEKYYKSYEGFSSWFNANIEF